MNTILFELGTEELPPKSLKTLKNALEDSVTKSLTEQNIAFDGIKSFSAPRRLAVQIKGVATVTPDKTETKKGPNIKASFDADGNLTKAGAGFLQGLNATGLNLTKGDLITVSDKKGEYIGYEMTIKGKAVDELLPKIIQKALDELPIAKRMRSGADRHEFVRPVQWTVLMRDETVIDAVIQGHQTGKQTRGHRYHAPDFVNISHADAYESLLKDKFVIADFNQRQALIKTQVATLANEVGAKAIVPDDLLDEVTALVDYPVALRASFEKRFLAVPQEALISTMQADQKYFCLTDADGKLLPYFIFISNINSLDKSQVILGNEKVVRPRLADAEFFFLQDQKQPLSAFGDALKSRIFQEKLGTIWDKSERIARLSALIASQIGANAEHAKKASYLAKCDLASTLVGEFPELQGIAGTYYAHLNGEPAEVAESIAEQYLPKFAGDELPKTDIGVCLALADRLDTLVGIFGIGEAPTGSKDPFSLRRASIGVLRILIEKDIQIPLSTLIAWATEGYPNKVLLANTADEVLGFINARYRPMYEERGVNVDSILAVQGVLPDSAPDFDKRIWATEGFKNAVSAKTLAQNNKRVANILAKAEGDISNNVNESLLKEPAEIALFEAVKSAQQAVAPMHKQAEYGEILSNLTNLDTPLTDFFDNVMVNTDDISLKNNRLALLKQVRELFLSVADVGELVI